MDALLAILRTETTVVKALAVTVGGLLGVFLTLGFFYLLIWAADRWGSRAPDSSATEDDAQA
ncbi:MAG: hypothetical protein QHH01_00865, partial [Spirochaetales bacterium]|nr:hypothetical protein [Spirochaetales bacterium]